MRTERWTNKDQLTALSQGWLLGDNGTTAEIQRHDTAEKFKSDAKALAFVRGRATRGDPTAAKALNLHGHPAVQRQNSGDSETCLAIAVQVNVVVNIFCDDWFDLDESQKRRILAENICLEQIPSGIDTYTVIDVTEG